MPDNLPLVSCDRIEPAGLASHEWANKRGDSPSSYVRECISSLEAAEAEQQASTHSPLAQV